MTEFSQAPISQDLGFNSEAIKASGQKQGGAPDLVTVDPDSLLTAMGH